jgi:hypothetical protein
MVVILWDTVMRSATACNMSDMCAALRNLKWVKVTEELVGRTAIALKAHALRE